ncbi:MAG: hypothetical protein A2Y40_02855 [Candidatus Margulisbacteria bacterium GWF2_35_9]|nr:MAG: hypothetical protein A2Y40_02855 [Candidatus Margulisbacteria bacterium GWF2_35_9]
MEHSLIKKDKDFFELWAEELGKRNKELLDQDFFSKQSQALVKSILEASKHIKADITDKEFSSIANILKVLISLQECNVCNEDIIHYLESLLITTEKAFSDSNDNDVAKFKHILKHILTYTKNQLSNELFLREEIGYLEKKAGQNILSMVGSSKTINQLILDMKPILDNDVTVLIDGETGTGKELMARAIHVNSQFKDGPFIALNCAAIPDDLMESEMFGYKKGSFTDASNDKPGKIELAHNGILFLDEINELSPKLQAKLLRVLQDKTVIRLGEVKERKINVKFVCSTNKDLKNLSEEGKFREDLFYRINVYRIQLPALRDRVNDIMPLAEYFLKTRSEEFHKTIKTFNKDAIQLLLKYNWPGNIRELDNVITRAVLKSTGSVLGIDSLDIYLTVPETISRDHNHTDLKSVEKTHIKFVIGKNNGNLMKSSKELGITRTTLYNKIREYQIET